MFKLLATDLDGTLFYPKRKLKLLTSKNRNFLTTYVKNGGHLVLVSGRHYNISRRIARKIKSPVDMIACNGSAVLKDGKIITDSPMNHQEILNFLKENRDDKLPISWVFMSDKYPMIVVPLVQSKIVRFFVRIGLKMQFSYREKSLVGEKHLIKLLNDPDARIYKMMAIYGLGKAKKEIARQETLKFIDAYGTKFEVLWSNESVEFMNKGVNKANALKNFLNVLELQPEEIAVVGDSGNDIPLFEAFPNSFVMAQAPDEVKKKAKTEIRGVYCIQDYMN